jgi:hypothetical protein
VGYGTIDPTETLHVLRDWNAPGVDTLAGVVHLRDYGSFIDSLKRNEFISIADVRLDPTHRTRRGRGARGAMRAPSSTCRWWSRASWWPCCTSTTPRRALDGATTCLHPRRGRAHPHRAERVRQRRRTARSQARLREANETLERRWRRARAS